MKVNKRLGAIVGSLGLWLLGVHPALAQWRHDWEVNLPHGVTSTSHEVYNLHMMVFWICVAIGVVVFGAIFYSVVRFRRSKGAVAAQFHHSTTVEIIWTIIPMLILIAIAVPSTKTLIAMKNDSKPDLTVKVTGYQWKWHYEYPSYHIGFFSTLDAKSNEARQLHSGIDPNTVPHYLLNVDHPLVVPIHKKILFLITSNDVIHSWWVPQFGWKQDAIPGYINTAWANIDKPGIYRGQCAELCGRGHAFMPIVVHAMTEANFQKWVAAHKGDQNKPITSPVGAD